MTTITKKLYLYFFTALLFSPLAAPALADWPDDRRGDRRKGNGPGYGMERGPVPYGGYCPKGHTDRYGARQPVLTVEDARERLSRFFAIDPARIKRVEERRHVFLAEITDPEGRPIELIVIDRRTGRIRSIR